MIRIAMEINFADIQAPLANDVIPTNGIIVLFICAFINYFAVNKHVLNRAIFHQSIECSYTVLSAALTIR